MLRKIQLLLALFGCCLAAEAAVINVAVASNFTAPMKIISAVFEQQTGHKAILAFGSTGHFFTQIKNGAPFDILLAADTQIPLRLEQEKLGIAESRFTYATGKLVLWSKQPGLVDENGKILHTDTFKRIAIANPKLAPYGAAALETMSKMGVLKSLQPKLVQGENIGQTYQFIATENAALGFIALSQILSDGKIIQGSAWIVPSSMHSPIRQDAILLSKARENPAALALALFLKGEQAQNIIRSFGYDI